MKSIDIHRSKPKSKGIFLPFSNGFIIHGLNLNTPWTRQNLSFDKNGFLDVTRNLPRQIYLASKCKNIVEDFVDSIYKNILLYSV